MRSFITAIAVAVALITGSMFYMNHLCCQSEKLIDLNNSITESVMVEDYDSANESIRKLKAEVESFEDFFLATGDHIEIDNIRINLSELEYYSKTKMKGDALAKANVLSFLFEHLPQNSRLKIGNIL